MFAGQVAATNLPKSKTTLVVAAALFASSSLIADTAILVALPAELEAVRFEVRVVGKPVELAGHRISIGYRKGQKLYIARTGARNVNAAIVTQALLTRYKVDGVISIGVAGYVGGNENVTTEIPRHARMDTTKAEKTENREATAENWKVGDILIATEVINHQAGKETPAGFDSDKEEQSAGGGQLSAEYKTRCDELRKTATEATTEILQQVHDNNTDKQPQAGTPTLPEPLKLKTEGRVPIASLCFGKLVSGDSFIASSEKRKWLRETFHADAVDMVSAGIARVCEANGVPYVIIRAVSDNADESASADFAAFVQKYKEPVTAKIALGIVDRIAAEAAHPQPK